jgi:hypothetical protein
MHARTFKKSHNAESEKGKIKPAHGLRHNDSACKASLVCCSRSSAWASRIGTSLMSEIGAGAARRVAGMRSGASNRGLLLTLRFTDLHERRQLHVPRQLRTRVSSCVLLDSHVCFQIRSLRNRHECVDHPVHTSSLMHAR